MRDGGPDSFGSGTPSPNDHFVIPHRRSPESVRLGAAMAGAVLISGDGLTVRSLGRRLRTRTAALPPTPG